MQASFTRRELVQLFVLNAPLWRSFVYLRVLCGKGFGFFAVRVLRELLAERVTLRLQVERREWRPEERLPPLREHHPLLRMRLLRGSSRE